MVCTKGEERGRGPLTGIRNALPTLGNLPDPERTRGKEKKRKNKKGEKRMGEGRDCVARKKDDQGTQ